LQKENNEDRNEDLLNSRESQSREKHEAIIRLLSRKATAYLHSLDDRSARFRQINDHFEAFDLPLPEVAAGATAAPDLLIRKECKHQ